MGLMATKNVVGIFSSLYYFYILGKLYILDLGRLALQ
jgi:hypothetical protein